jgi:hypothetical protein
MSDNPIGGDVADGNGACAITADTDLDRAGVDSRRRGWFWHWNNVVTQYAPLIGLKGVGLLNSYTVWTDRREESPHRGYAFPGQQSEAAFYGEERAELITINKILVALELIEIRKEMILKVDERGRRWRVPHNLYRVRDRPDGVNLRATDVMRVASLAVDDAAVFRYVRRVFSPRFKPIDRDNVWHAILEELASNPLWLELQERTRTLEERASARTRAGHRRRAADNQAQDPETDESATEQVAVLTIGQSGHAVLPDTEQTGSSTLGSATSVEPTTNGSGSHKTSVDQTNNASDIDVGERNSAFGTNSLTSAAGTNTGQKTAVGQSNTTYHQPESTTTTTTTSADQGDQGDQDGEHDLPDTSATPDRRTSVRVARFDAVRHDTSAADFSHEPLEQQTTNSAMPNNQQQASTAMSGDEVLASAATDTTDRHRHAMQGNGEQDATGVGPQSGAGAGAANGAVALVGGTGTVREDSPSGDRRADGATPRSSAGEWSLAGSVADSQRCSGPLGDRCPVVVSLFDAANDRRSTPLERILLAELEHHADPPARAVGATGCDWVAAALREAVSAGSAFVAPKRIREIINRWAASGDGPAAAGYSQSAAMAAPANVSQPALAQEVRLPGGARGASTWQAVLQDLANVLESDAFSRLLAGSTITRYWRGTVDIEVATPDAAGKLSSEYRGLVERNLNARLRKPVSVAFHSAEAVAPSGTSEAATPISPATTPEIVISHGDVELGRQVWHAILVDLTPSLTLDDLERLNGVIPLGEDAAGTMLLGTPSPIARRLIEGRYRPEIEHSLATLLGHPVTVRAVDSDAWAVEPAS